VTTFAKRCTCSFVTRCCAASAEPALSRGRPRRRPHRGRDHPARACLRAGDGGSVGDPRPRSAAGARPVMAPLEIRVDYSPPAHRAMYEQFFGCPVRFNADAVEYRFSADTLDDPLELSMPKWARVRGALRADPRTLGSGRRRRRPRARGAARRAQPLSRSRHRRTRAALERADAAATATRRSGCATRTRTRRWARRCMAGRSPR
jgi:hypothetical protein